MKNCNYEVLSTFTSPDGKFQANVVLDDNKIIVEYIEDEVLLKVERCTNSIHFAECMAENYILGLKKL